MLVIWSECLTFWRRSQSTHTRLIALSSESGELERGRLQPHAATAMHEQAKELTAASAQDLNHSISTKHSPYQPLVRVLIRRSA